eukprot:EG_transcript_22779
MPGSKAVSVCTVPLPAGLTLSASEWEEKRQALEAFCRQLFGGESGTGAEVAADKAAEAVTIRAEVPGTWDVPERRYLHGGDVVEYPETFAIRMAPSQIHGRGMFATKDFVEGEIVEVCPTLEVHHSCVGGILEDYVYYGDDKDDRVLVMGYGMMYNSIRNANLWYYRDDEKNFVFVATRPIQKGEELFIDYGGEWWDTRENKHMKIPDGFKDS